LLTGDIEAPQERALLQRAAEQLRADVLLAPHHGSGTSSTPAFLDAVAPKIALFQVGYRNRYRHPKAEVVERYHQRGIAVLRTDRSGAVSLQIDHSGIKLTQTCETPRYWSSQRCH
jgi:competence protein ComEC